MAAVEVSAPGKVILHGEHAVVYGKRALAASLNLRTSLMLERTTKGHVEVILPDINIEASWAMKTLQHWLPLPLCKPLSPEPPSVEAMEKIKDLVAHTIKDEMSETRVLALVAFLYLYGSISDHKSLPSISLKVSSSLPPSAGLGSSAAYSACLATSLLCIGGYLSTSHREKLTDSDRELINKWSFQAEKIIHGRPSGIDNSVSTFGGVMSFQSGQITPLSRVPQLRVLLVNTQVPRSTKVLVAGVKDRHDKYPDIFKPVLDSIQAISNQCEASLSTMATEHDADHYTVLQDLIRMNQFLLNFIGVGHASLDSVCRVCASHRLEAKLTGAGGGGCAFTILPPDFSGSQVSAVSTELSALGYDCWETQIGGAGVVIHS